MKYLCLIYEDQKKMQAMPKAEMDEFIAECFAFTGDIQKSGNYVAGDALQPAHVPATIRMRNAAETEEQLGGYYVINAKNLEDAIQVASRIPGARHGSVEVRPIMEYQQPAERHH